MKTWIQTHSGIAFDLLKPTPDMIVIDDIAHALSNLCRFTGHSKFYSVAQHSRLASFMVSEQFALQALMHDASEAYLTDISAPLKALPCMAEYKKLEAKLEELAPEWMASMRIEYQASRLGRWCA